MILKKPFEGIFKMNTLKLLISRLCNNFSFHHARKETIGAILFGLIMTGNVQRQSFARFLSTSNPQNTIRRIERFFAEIALSFAESALTIVNLLGFEGKLQLCLDRTNWKFGEKDINYLVLSWRINKKISLFILMSLAALLVYCMGLGTKIP